MSELLKYKLADYEVPPPEGAWEIIARDLKESKEYLPLSQKMYDFEVPPPSNSWNRIITGLQNAALEVPTRRIGIPVYKIAIAASIIGIVLLGGLYFWNNRYGQKQNEDTRTATSNNNKDKPSGSSSIDAGISDIDAPVPNQARQLTAAISGPHLNKGKKYFSRGNTRRLRNAIVKNVRSIESELRVMIAAKPIRNESGEIIPPPENIGTGDNKYIDITGPNGEQTRISSKFLNALLYLNGNPNIEEYEGYFNKNFLESIIWTTRFQDWRNKIIETSFVPSSTNFMDILEFRDLLTKDKEQQ